MAREPQLASLLGDTARPVEGRVQLLDSVLGDKVYPVTATLLREAVRLPRSRHLDVVAEELAELAAARRDRSVAKVRTPVELSSEQETKLAETLGRMYGRTISCRSSSTGASSEAWSCRSAARSSTAVWRVDSPQLADPAQLTCFGRDRRSPGGTTRRPRSREGTTQP